MQIFKTAILRSKGRYVWLFGDDDLIASDILGRVVVDLMCYQPDVFIGPAIFDDSQKKATHHFVSEKMLLEQKSIAKMNVIHLAGKMSGLIFNKEKIVPWILQSESIVKQTRTPWPHLIWLLLMMNQKNARLLAVPYGTNQLVSAHWHNLLFDGKTLIKLHFIDYQTLLKAIENKLDPLFYKALIHHSLSENLSGLIKCVMYGTYMDSYFSLLFFAWSCWSEIIGFKK